MKYFSFLLMIGLSHTVNANDFKTCNDYFKRNQVAGGASINYGRPPDFSFSDDGKLSVNSDANLKVENGKEIIEVRTIDYSAIPTTGLKANMTLPTKVVRHVISRDSKGRVISILFDQNLTKAEIDRKVERAKEYRDQAKRNGAIVIGSDDQIPFYDVASSEAEFFYNEKGECVPSKSKFTMLVEPKVDGMKMSQTLFDTKLCHDVDKFFKENPETRACYDKGLNEKMAKVFSQFIPKETRVAMERFGGDAGGGYGYSGMISGGVVGISGFGGGFGGGFGYMGGMGVESKVIQASSNFTSPMFKTSPVLTGAEILEGCKMMGLESFYNNEDNFKVSSSGIIKTDQPVKTEEK